MGFKTPKLPPPPPPPKKKGGGGGEGTSTANKDVTGHHDCVLCALQLLKEMKRWAKLHHTTAELEENQNKNRDPHVLPGTERSLLAISLHPLKQTE